MFAIEWPEIVLLFLLAFLFSLIAAGAVLARQAGKSRWGGVLFLVEGAGAVFLVVWMSSRYWFGGEEILHTGLTPLLVTVGIVLLSLGLTVVLIFGLVRGVNWLLHRRYWGLALAGLLMIWAAVTGGTVAWLLAATLPREPITRDPQKGEIKIVPGFAVTIFSAERFKVPANLEFGPDGQLYVCDKNGIVWAIADVNRDGKGETPREFARGFNTPVGLAWNGNDLYVASHGIVSVIRDRDGDGRADERRDIVTGLPARLYPWHANNDLTFGSDGRLYFAVGSTTDAATETHPYAASILSVNPDGSDLRIFATGVRNPFDLAFNAEGDLFATDNGPDGWKIAPGDELNYIVEGGDYGFPRYFEEPPIGSGTHGPVLIFPPHASADGITFYNGQQFPPEYRDNAFVALWNRHEVYRIQLNKTPNGDYEAHGSLFASGFLNPLDVATGPDGSLYVLDYSGEAIYRITYTGVQSPAPQPQ